MKKNNLPFFCLLISTHFVFSQTQSDIKRIINDYDLNKLKELQILLKNKEDQDINAAYKIAKEKKWLVKSTKKDSTLRELRGVTSDGHPLYYVSNNAKSAQATRTDFLHSDGDLGLALNGEDMVIRVWDIGNVRKTHMGFDNRVIAVDNESATLFDHHPTHVTGTLIASPWEMDYSPMAKGMAPCATARVFNVGNDKSEAVSETSLGMLISNHSYGIELTPTLPSWFIGSYVSDSRDWDEITYNAPYYLPVFSAGNEGEYNSNTDPIAYGYDKLLGSKTSKNVLVVANGHKAKVANDGSLTSVVINSASSQGPTDDGRIKPDITGNGTNVFSLAHSTDINIVSASGTSMAAAKFPVHYYYFSSTIKILMAYS